MFGNWIRCNGCHHFSQVHKQSRYHFEANEALAEIDHHYACRRLRISFSIHEMYSLESFFNSVRSENEEMKRAELAEVIYMKEKEMGRRNVVDGSRMILRLQSSLGAPAR